MNLYIHVEKLDGDGSAIGIADNVNTVCLVGVRVGIGGRGYEAFWSVEGAPAYSAAEGPCRYIGRMVLNMESTSILSIIRDKSVDRYITNLSTLFFSQNMFTLSFFHLS